MDEQNTNPAPAGQPTPSVGPQPTPTPDEPMQRAVNVSEQMVTPPKPPKKKKSWLVVLIVLLAVGLVGGAAYMLLGSKSDTGDSTASEVKNDIPLLKMGISSDSLNVDLPFDSLSDDTLQLFQQTHEGLVSWSNLTNIVPALAKSWTTDTTGTTWVFTIDTSRKFHTGKPVTPEAIKASIDAFIALDAELPTVLTIDKVTVKGTDAVEIVTKTPDATLLNRLASMPIYDTEYPEGQAWASGTGAFTLKKDTVPTDTTLMLVADDNYRLGRPYVREIEVTSLGTYEDAQKMLQDGTLDIATYGPSDEATVSSLSANYTYTPMKGTGSYALRFNTIRDGALFKEAKLREAVAYVIDNDKIIAADENQPGVPTNQIVPETIPGYNPNLPTITPDLTKAKTLMTEGKYTNQVVKVGYFKGVQDAPMLEVVRQLKEAGFNVQESFKESGREFAGAIEAGEYDIISASSLSSINDLTDVAADMGSSSSYTPMYFDPTVDTMISEANATFDPAARLAKLQDISKFFADQHGVIPVRVSTYPNYVKKTIVTGSMDLLTPSNPYYLYKIYGK